MREEVKIISQAGVNRKKLKEVALDLSIVMSGPLSYPRKHVSLWTSNCRFRSSCSLGNGFLYVCRFFRDVFDRKVVVKREQVLKILRQTLLFSSSSWTTQVDDEEEENRKNSKLNAKVNGKITIKQKRVKRNSHTKSHRRRRRNSRLQNLGRHPFNKAIPRTNPLYFALLNPSLSLQLRVLIRFARQNWVSQDMACDSFLFKHRVNQRIWGRFDPYVIVLLFTKDDARMHNSYAVDVDPGNRKGCATNQNNQTWTQ